MNKIIDINNGNSYSIFSNWGRKLLKMYIKHYVSKGGMYDDAAVAAMDANEGNVYAQDDERIGINSAGDWEKIGNDQYIGEDGEIVKKCDECGGDGEIDCPYCEDGFVVCYKCGGEGELNCPYCNNQTLRSGLVVGCNYCVNNSYTQYDIYGVEPGKVVCPECGGEDRITTCDECDEIGKIECEKCGGSGNIYA
jgi:uncharacterized Zn-finger protein